MSYHDSRTFVFGDNKRTTIFPSLKKTFYNNSLVNRKSSELSLDEKAYRMTSNQLLKGFMRHNDGELKKLRETFVKLTGGVDEKSKKKVGQYDIIKQLGKGGFAQVYEVQDNNHKRYALKQYNLQNSLQCFHNEANIGQHFFQKGKIKGQYEQTEGSDNLICFVDKFKYGKYGYIVQQLSQHSLSKIISEIQGIFHNNQRIYEVKFKEFYRDLVGKGLLRKMMIQICQAVSLLNKSGFIHCDLKLENIMIQFRDNIPTVKIIDFGSTFELRHGLPKITITPEYMPPELLTTLENGSSDYTNLTKIDVWSIGCILLELLTGIPLWFRYKCRVQLKGKPTIQLGVFALTGRDYQKIMRKQKQLCESIHKISITHKQLDKYRPILKKILVIDPQKRLTAEQCVKLFEDIE